MYIKTSVLIFIALTFVKIASAQHLRKDVPLFIFLQNNTDSTLVLEHTGSRIEKPNLMILSKKGDTISAYQYKDTRTFAKSGWMPKTIRDSIYKNNRLNSLFSPLDVNIYFNSKYISVDSIDVFWKQIMDKKPWQIKDDKNDMGEGCPISDKMEYNKKYIIDAGGIALYLITKNRISPLYFYAPDYFERKEICPGNVNRQAILKISDLFSEYFKD